MDHIRIAGGRALKGTIPISGAKNAALPLMAAALLTESPLILENLPDLKDIKAMTTLLGTLGVAIDMADRDKSLQLCATTLSNTTAPYDIVQKMRASILILGPLLARAGQAEVPLPGGCAIGSRPIDVHLEGLRAMGAQIDIKDYTIQATAPKGLQGTTYTFPVTSVTGTENLLMAACLAQGTTCLQGAAREPEITDLAHCLVQMGAKIEGIGTGTLHIEGVTSLTGNRYRVMPDRIEAGTYMMAAGITGGDLTLLGANLDDLPTVVPTLKKIGLVLETIPQGARVTSPGPRELRPTTIITRPFPGFATDLQAQLMALLTCIPGTSTITETVFEDRFQHVTELERMGANIAVEGSVATVYGGAPLHGATVQATDLRASFSLVLAALAAKGETILEQVHHLDRGYEAVEKKLSDCGAQIERCHSVEYGPHRADEFHHGANSLQEAMG